MIRILEAQVRVDEDIRREKEQKYAQRGVAGERRNHDPPRDKGYEHRRHPYSGGRGSDQHYRQPRKEILNVEHARDKTNFGRSESKESAKPKQSEEQARQG